MAAHPQPDLDEWRRVKDPGARLRAALEELYAYYRRTEGMFSNIIRDEKTMPTVARMMSHYWDYMERAREALMSRRPERGRARRRARAAVGHALAFTTWQSLARRQGLADAEAAEMMCRLVGVAGANDGGHGRRP
jgi:hypothetical protein